MKKKLTSLIFLVAFSGAAHSEYKMVFKNNPVKIPVQTEEASGDFQYVRIQILNNNGSAQYVSLGEVNWVINGQSYPDANLTAYTNSPAPYKVTDSGFVGTNANIYGGWKLYDGEAGQYGRWLGDENFPHEINLDLGQSFDFSDLERVELLAGNHISADLNERSVRHFKVFISENGSDWVEKLEVNNIDASEWQAGVNNTYQF